jgi:hypothetical protein
LGLFFHNKDLAFLGSPGEITESDRISSLAKVHVKEKRRVLAAPPLQNGRFPPTVWTSGLGEHLFAAAWMIVKIEQA